MKELRIGTRGSRLALWQANFVAEQLIKSGWNTRIVTIETTGDKSLDTTIAKIGSKGVFTEEIEQQLREGAIDIAVHSAKDMPSQLPDDLELIAFAERENPSDVLVSRGEVSLDSNIRVGTSSTRRVGILKHYYPEVEIVPVRGNLQTRLSKMDDGLCDALLLAYAGVHRMGYDELIREELSKEIFVPPVGQGSVTVEATIALPERIREVVRKAINHAETETCVLSERAFLKTLEGGCSVPAFCHATLNGRNIHLYGGVVSLDGKQLVSERLEGPATQGQKLAVNLAERILKGGGDSILKEIKNMS